MTMQKVTEDLLKLYEELSVKRKPRLHWRVDPQLEREQFSVSYTGGILRVEADSELTFVFALQQIVVALSSGHLGESLGKFTPRFSLRPLKLIAPQSVEEICRLGFNAVILDEGDFSQYREYGIKVFTTNKESKDADGIFWESSLLNPDFYSREMTLAELVLVEVKELEAALGRDKTLIYYIPTIDEIMAKQQATWFSDLCDDVGNQTIIAFPSVSGDPTADHLTPHPFWQTLRSTPDVSATPFMPLLNVGAINQGECLWPSLSLDVLQERFERHHFAGAVCLSHTVSEKKGFLHLSLWVASMWMWHGRDPKSLAETWCLAHRPDLDFVTNAPLLDRVRTVVKDLNVLKEKEGKAHALAESVHAQLNLLKTEFEKTSFCDYFTCFEVDARNLLGQVSQKYSLGKDSFWTSKQEVFDRPQRGKPGSVMEKIFEENT